MVGGVLAGVGGLCLNGCGGAVREPFLSNRRTPAGLSQDAVFILYHASLAPSGHNSQPWYVKVLKSDEWIVGFDRARSLPAVDPQGRESLLSIGAFIENLSLSAGIIGYEVDIDYLMENRNDSDLVKVVLTPGKKSEYPLDRIKKRRTVKTGQLNEPLKKDTISALSSAAGDGFFYFPRGTDHSNCITEFAVECYKLQMKREDAKLELVEWLRLKNDEAKRNRDGLTTGGMEITGVPGWYVRNFVDKNDFIKPDFIGKAVEKTAQQATEGAGWIILTGNGSKPEHLIEAGRRFERMALIAREHNVGIHPMTQILEEDGGLKMIADNHDGGMSPQFILRAGYVRSYPDPVSLRRPVEWFVHS